MEVKQLSKEYATCLQEMNDHIDYLETQKPRWYAGSPPLRDCLASQTDQRSVELVAKWDELHDTLRRDSNLYKQFVEYNR